MSELQIFDCQQGSWDWHQARLGIPTASEFQTIMTKGRSGEPSKTRRTYMLKLIGEVLTGESAEAFSNVHTDRGHEMEGEARDLYAMLRDVEPRQVGFLRRGPVGASPDSLIDDDGLLEIKTKLPHLHLELLLAGELPKEHKAQCQGQLWIAGRQWLDFLSYWPGLPPFLVRVQRDDDYIAELQVAVGQFVTEMQEALAKIRAASSMLTREAA